MTQKTHQANSARSSSLRKPKGRTIVSGPTSPFPHKDVTSVKECRAELTLSALASFSFPATTVDVHIYIYVQYVYVCTCIHMYLCVRVSDLSGSLM